MFVSGSFKVELGMNYVPSYFVIQHVCRLHFLNIMPSDRQFAIAYYIDHSRWEYANKSESETSINIERIELFTNLILIHLLDHWWRLA